MTTVDDTYAITTPRNPGVIHSVSPGICLHDYNHGVPYGTTFDSFHLAAVDETTTEHEVLTGAPGVVFTFMALMAVVYTGTTAPEAARSLIFMDGTGGTEIGRITIPPELKWVHEYWCVFDPPVSLTSGNGLFCALDGALGTTGAYTVIGSYWEL